jgi:hypothetical protein
LAVTHLGSCRFSSSAAAAAAIAGLVLFQPAVAVEGVL